MFGRYRTTSLFVLSLIGLVVCLSSLSSPAAAHKHVLVGEYEFIVGWREEPPVVGVLNGLFLGIERHLPNGTTVWVEGAETSLAAVLATGPSSVTKSLEPLFGQPGRYTFDIVPTREGLYSVRVQGNLSGTAVDFTIEIEAVVARSVVEFPTPDPTPSELQQSIDQVAAANAALRAQLGTATAIAVVAVAVGLVGLGIGVIAWRRGARKQ